MNTGFIMLQYLFGPKGKSLTQREIYQQYLQLSRQLSETPDLKSKPDSTRLELELALDLLWERMDGYAKRHHG